MLRHRNENVELGANKLIELGVLSEDGLEALGRLFRGLQSLAIGNASPTVRRVSRPVTKKRGKRGRFDISDAEFRDLYVSQGKTAKEIAGMYGVAPGTVAVKASKLGLKKRGGAKKAKKKAGAKRKYRKKASSKKRRSKN